MESRGSLGGSVGKGYRGHWYVRIYMELYILTLRCLDRGVTHITN